MPTPADAPSTRLADDLLTLRGSGLTFPESLAAALTDVDERAVLARNDGLPRLDAALRTRSALRVCYLGGSVTEQKAGWRPRVTGWLGGTCTVEEVPAFCGNCGSKVLIHLVADWVIARAPHLVFVELSINDGDTLLETEQPEALGCAFEGIVRHIRRELPRCEVCVVSMFVRDELPLHQRTGTKAWTDNAAADAADAYHAAIPALHGRIAAHYGAPHVSLVPLFAALPSPLRQLAFRDDCHHTEVGAALAAAAVCLCVRRMCMRASGGEGGGGAGGGGHEGGLEQQRGSLLPPPLHSAVWPCGRTQPVKPEELSCLYVPLEAAPRDPQQLQVLQQRLLQRHTQLDMDPLRPPQRAAWWLLYAGEYAEVAFSGSRLAILTMLGPDAGVVRCDVDGGARVTTLSLLDKWAYYWRLSVVLLVDDLPPGEHRARLTLERERPDGAAAVLKRPPAGEHWEACVRNGREHKLWLMHWLVS